MTGKLEALKNLGLKTIDLSGCRRIEGSLEDFTSFVEKKIEILTLDYCPLITGKTADLVDIGLGFDERNNKAQTPPTTQRRRAPEGRRPWRSFRA